MVWNMVLRRTSGDPLGFPSAAVADPVLVAGGWVHLGPIDQLRRSGVTNLRRFGRDVVVFADSGGAVHATEAVCPHLGAHLGGSEVVGDCIRCPFHHWQFGTDGAVRHVPNAKRIPHRARLEIIPVVEVGGVALMWQPPSSATGAARPPSPDAALTDALRAPSAGRRTTTVRAIEAPLAEVVARFPLATPVDQLHTPAVDLTDDRDGPDPGRPVVIGSAERRSEARSVGTATATAVSLAAAAKTTSTSRAPAMPGRWTGPSLVTALALDGRVGPMRYGALVLLAPMELDRTAALAIVRTPDAPTGLARVAHLLARRQVLADLAGRT